MGCAVAGVLVVVTVSENKMRGKNFRAEAPKILSESAVDIAVVVDVVDFDVDVVVDVDVNYYVERLSFEVAVTIGLISSYHARRCLRVLSQIF